MLSTIIKTVPILVSLTIACGLFTHGTRVDNVLVASVSKTSISDSYGSNHIKLSPVEHHVHVDGGTFLGSIYNFGSQQPANSPRNQDDKKYISWRRLTGNDLGDGYCWPSI